MSSLAPVVRAARAADLRHLAAVEDSGGVLFEELFGDLAGDALGSPAPSGAERADQPGLLLVTGPLGDPTGFVHVTYVDGHAHLAQLSVRADALRTGLGTMLVRAAQREAWAAGFSRLSLTTYRDVAWNAPFYARLGFAEDHEPEDFELRQRDREVALGLDRHGPRVVMSCRLRRPGAPPE